MLSYPTERSAPIIYKPVLESTNSFLKAVAAEGALEGTVVIAGSQIGGRGRQGRSFESPPGGLYMSMLIKPLCPPQQALSITTAAAVAVCRALDELGISGDIKWPNDILSRGKKLCGILTESVLQGDTMQVILGIGLNVNSMPGDFSPPLRPSISSLRAETGQSHNTEHIASMLIRHLDGICAHWKNAPLFHLEEYRSRCISCGRDVLILKGEVSRRAKSLYINDDLSLRVLLPDGIEENISFGEVSIR